MFDKHRSLYFSEFIFFEKKFELFKVTNTICNFSLAHRRAKKK